MHQLLKTGLWKQFGAAIDTLRQAVTLCPDAVWTVQVWQDDDDPRYGQFWAVAGHTLKWLDVYLEGGSKDYQTPAPFIRNELPAEPYSKDDVLAYLDANRAKCRDLIDRLTSERANEPCIWGVPWFELQLYNMRHVQEHAAHLQLVLGTHGVSEVDWVSAAQDPLNG